MAEDINDNEIVIKERKIDLEAAAKKRAEYVIKQLEKESGKLIPDELREKHLGYRNIKHVRTFIERGHDYNANLFLRQCMRDLKLEMIEKGIIPRPQPKIISEQRGAKATGILDYYNIDDSSMMPLSKN
jgi:predicted nucleotide-binding protein